jgi:transposase
MRAASRRLRAGLYRPVHVKTLRSQKLRMLLTHRKVGTAGKMKFEARIKEFIGNLPDLSLLVEPLLIVRRVLREQGHADR